MGLTSVAKSTGLAVTLAAAKAVAEDRAIAAHRCKDLMFSAAMITGLNGNVNSVARFHAIKSIGGQGAPSATRRVP
jgi:hypothetical protein